jgi:predicted transcriptional regulator
VTIRKIQELLQAQILLGGDRLDEEVDSAFGADLMSDVLAFVQEKTVLITGLVNQHVIRTAEMLDIFCIVFSRGKIPEKEILDEAEENGIIVLSTKFTSYTSSGILYAHGLPGVDR